VQEHVCAESNSFKDLRRIQEAFRGSSLTKKVAFIDAGSLVKHTPCACLHLTMIVYRKEHPQALTVKPPCT
jgi:hypothetical protein